MKTDGSCPSGGGVIVEIFQLFLYAGEGCV